MPFSNTQLSISDIPSIQEIEYNKLHASYLNVNLIASFIFWVIVIFAISVITMMNRLMGNKEVKQFLTDYPYAILIGFVTIAVIRMVIIYFGFHQKGYALREKDISYKKGLFWKAKTVIPFNRIQHVEVKQGPIERIAGLSSLHIYTAGGSSSDLTIEGLDQEEANRLKQYVINKSSKNGESSEPIV